MSRNGHIELRWADGTHKFRLGLGELEELDEKTDRGPYELLRMINDGTWRAKHLYEIIRIALIGGGGCSPTQATRLIERYVIPRPVGEWVPWAQAIMLAAVVGAPDGEQPGKRQAAKGKKAQSDQEGSSLSPQSTGKEQQQDLLHSKSVR